MNILDIAKAINNKLSTLNINIVSDDIKSGFEKPAFFVQMTIISSTLASTIITANIQYFPDQKNQLELIKMTDDLNDMFGDYVIEIDEKNSLLIDEIRVEYPENFLQYSMDMTIENEIDMFPESEYVLMEHLKLKGV